MDDSHDLRRFVDAQAGVFDAVLAELAAGRKRSHWMWFVFPQLAGLGRSATAQRFALTGLDDARAYLADPLLGARLRQCCTLLAGLPGRDPHAVFGSPDDLKLHSSLTLFARAAPGEALFARAWLSTSTAGKTLPRSRCWPEQTAELAAKARAFPVFGAHTARLCWQFVHFASFTTMKITDTPPLRRIGADMPSTVPAGFAAMLGDAIVKESGAVQRPDAFHAVRLDAAQLATRAPTVSLSQVGADGSVGGAPLTAGAVIVHAQVPDGSDDVAAYDDKLAQLKKVLDLEDKLGRPIPVVLEMHTRNGFGAVDLNRFHAASDLFANTLGAVQIMNDDGRFNHLLRKYGGALA